MTRAVLSLGSNLGNRLETLQGAIDALEDTPGVRIKAVSPVYETEPVGVADEQPAYLNMVAELDADALRSPEELLARLLKIEYALGRRRTRPLAARTLDLDLLLYGEERSESPLLTLPHPRLHLRRFVLAPLAELAPDCEHPTERQTFAQLLAAVPDHSRVRLWRPQAAGARAKS